MNNFIHALTSHFSDNTIHGITSIVLSMLTWYYLIVNLIIFIKSPFDLFSFLNIRLIAIIILLWFIWFKTIK